MSRRRTSAALVALVGAVALCACRSSLPHRWRHPALGFEMHSDFDLVRTEYVFDRDVRARIAALQRLFGVDDLRGLHVYVHDASDGRLGGLRVAGWHGGGEIHVMAGYGKDLQAAMPKMSSQETFLHELVHALVQRAELQLPRWFEEGLCEVLSSSILDGEGRLLLLPNVERERLARRLWGRDEWLSGVQLLAYDDHYPDDEPRMSALYAEGTSFVWHLVREQPPADAAAIRAVAARPRAELLAAFHSWRDEVASGSLSRLMLPLCAHPHPAVRRHAADGLDPDPSDEGWWQAAARLLADPDRGVRATMRLRALLFPPDSADAALRYADWSTAEDRQLRLAGLLALAELGGVRAAQRFCRELTEADGEWGQPMIWLLTAVPRADGGRRRLPPEMLSSPQELVRGARALADELELLAPRLSFDAAARRYRLDR
ncbi:MAG: hypothetical protein KAI24_12795 [Planctomycetes bacterium]|nr:hypothetical protein [Planctomycetota bacterium]